jgi:hypothetical protein
MCFFTTEVSALMRVDIPKKTVQGSVIRVLIQDQAPGMHKVHFCPVGWSESRKCVEFDPVSLDNGNDFVLIPIGVDETPGMAIISVFSVTSAYAVPIIIEKVNFEVAKGVTLTRKKQS